MQSTVTDRKHLLFVHQGALGDFIVTFPILRSLRTAYARIDGICRSEFGRLAKHLALIDGFYPQDAARFASLYTTDADPSVADLLKAYDQVLLFSFSDTLEKSLRCIKPDAVHRIPPWPRQEKGQVTDFLFQRLKETNLLPPQTHSTAGGFGSDLAIDPGPPVQPIRDLGIILGPGAGSVSKRWPLDGFVQVAEELTEIGFQPAFVFGPAEDDLEAALSTHAAAAWPLHRPRNLVRLAELLRSAGGYIGNDSAVSHLAAFLGLPVVVIFGPSNPDRWRPNGPRVIVLPAPAAPGSQPSETEAGWIESAWFKQIPPAMVLASFLDLIHRTGIERGQTCS